jgi:FkbM family methyltransferase
MFMPLAVSGVSWVTRHCHGLPGRWRLLRWLERHRDVLAQLPAKTVRLTPGFRMRVSPLDENGRRVYVHGLDRRERITRQFVRLLRPGDCVIDIGANVGYFTLVAARLVGPGGCVHAFEPSPEVLPWLQANADLNPSANIRVHGQAVTDRCGQVRFYTAAADRTGYSSIRNLGCQTASAAMVPAITLDSMLPELPRVRLVKIDVEGAELLVLRGMRELIRRDRPFLIIELDDGFLRELGADAQRECDFLSDAGYELYRIVARGDLQPLERAPTDRCNLLACPAGDGPPGGATEREAPASAPGTRSEPRPSGGGPQARRLRHRGSGASSRGCRGLGTESCPRPNA